MPPTSIRSPGHGRVAGFSSAALVIGGLAFLVGTSLITIAISTIIAKQHGAS